MTPPRSPKSGGEYGANVERVSRQVEAWPLHSQRSMATFTAARLRRSADAVEANAAKDASHRRAVADHMEATGTDTLTVSQILHWNGAA